MFKWLDKQCNNLNAMDFACVKIAVFFVTIAIVKYLPKLLHLRYSVVILLAIVFGLRPFIRFFFGRPLKKQ